MMPVTGFRVSKARRPAVLPTGSFPARRDLLRDIELRDRRYYAAGHGDLWTASEAVDGLADRAWRLAKRHP